MKARSSERTMENSALIGMGGLLSVVPRAKTVPPNLAGIYQKGRKTSRFRSSKPTDIADLRLQINYHR
ncbi:hypothetical protein [Rhizobium leguminosarum]|uniref:hypothetical protein n=1 Tax=Rhizobium leguminosarum TaxID=384 RepID=UPI0013EE592E|nr:hypothetical protein [Rhizobium leguminosarum]